MTTDQKGAIAEPAVQLAPAKEVDAIAAYNLELDRCFLIPIAGLKADRQSLFG